MHLHNPTKKSLAESGGLSRSMLYYRPKMPERDWQLKVRIEGVLHAHPSYGHKRIARELGVNRKSALRVMKLFGIKPFRRRAKRPVKARDSGRDAAPYQNLLLAIPFPARAGIAWVSDFTYLKFHGRFVYLATVMVTVEPRGRRLERAERAHGAADRHGPHRRPGQARRTGTDPLRPGQRVPGKGLHQVCWAVRHPGIHEPQGEPVGERLPGVVLLAVQG